MKRILDTVHGYIMVGDEFINHIIDTPFFQCLRRIEQTSIRLVYPSARHDCFIHALGVYHIGSLIIGHLKNEAKAYEYWGETETTMMVLYNSYLAACLLHDIAHAPFSHTFEHYYGKKTDLALLLKNTIKDEYFNLGQIKKPLKISGFIIVGFNLLQSVAFFHFLMQPDKLLENE